jgi:outer membrane protein assembly factor BamB
MNMIAARLPIVLSLIAGGNLTACSKPPAPSNPDTSESKVGSNDRGDGPRPCPIQRSTVSRPLARKPQLLWSADIPSLGIKSQVAITEERVAVSAGATLFLFDHKGQPRGSWRNPSNAQISAPTAGPTGDFFVAADIAASIDPDGRQRWLRPLRTDDVMHGPASQPLLLSPTGQLYSLQADGIVQALSERDGTLLWRRSLESPAPIFQRLVGGVETFLIANLGERSFVRLQTSDGDMAQPRGALAQDKGYRFASTVLAGGAVLYGETLASGSRVGMEESAGRVRWVLDARKDHLIFPVLLTHSGEVVLLETEQNRGEGKPETLIHVSCAGARLRQVQLDPGREGYFGSFALGDDGTTYGLTFPAANSNGGVKLTVFDSDYRPQWHHQFPRQGVPSTGGVSLVIARDGTLYLALQTQNFTGKLYAIRTTSPGLAATALASARMDAAGSGWTP